MKQGQKTHLVQATVYDATRRRLLQGREDMLGLVAAQLKHKVESKEIKAGKAVWVDVSFGISKSTASKANQISRSAAALGRNYEETFLED